MFRFLLLIQIQRGSCRWPRQRQGIKSLGGRLTQCEDVSLFPNNIRCNSCCVVLLSIEFWIHELQWLMAEGDIQEYWWYMSCPTQSSSQNGLLARDARLRIQRWFPGWYYKSSSTHIWRGETPTPSSFCKILPKLTQIMCFQDMKLLWTGLLCMHWSEQDFISCKFWKWETLWVMLLLYPSSYILPVDRTCQDIKLLSLGPVGIQLAEQALLPGRFENVKRLWAGLFPSPSSRVVTDHKSIRRLEFSTKSAVILP